MEQLIFILVVIAATIIHAWWTRKQVEAEQQEQTRERERGTRPSTGNETNADDSPSTSRPRPSPLDWEEQMRRLLEGVLPPPPKPAPPPPPRPSASVPGTVPPPLPSHAPPALKPKPAAPPPVLARSHFPVPDDGLEMTARPVSLHRAVTAHERAQIQTNVAERLHATSARVTSHAGGATVARPQSLLGAQVRALVGNRRSAQAALVAAALLGPPRAMDPIE